ncbi:MAG: molybdopterin-dependent oxidoreductase, partial [Chloroflexota bacterium]|nr:molybdopterin-dependent oxidoreductase [Chloroflexota bacterium]
MAESDDLVYLTREPINAEVRVERIRGLITPAGQHYVRGHFPIPAAPAELTIGGAVEDQIRLTLDQIRSLPARALAVTLECAGNGRRFLQPPVPGEQWGLGAVGTAEWTGTPLRAVLESARPRRDAVDVLFVGADRGMPAGTTQTIPFERSLPLADAMNDDVLLAYAMNGVPLPPEHG